MADSPRIEELKRRVQSDPASIAFAALAEEYRRAERFEEAIETCRSGLVRHPSYLSAHVTLGRALIEVGRLQDAREELEYVLKLAPENLAAIRGLAEIHSRMGEDGGDLHVAAAVVAEPVAPPIPLAVAHEPPSVPTASPPVKEEIPEPPVPVMASTGDIAFSTVESPSAGAADVTYPSPVDPALAGLEEFLNAIIRARAERAAAR